MKDTMSPFRLLIFRSFQYKYLQKWVQRIFARINSHSFYIPFLKCFQRSSRYYIFHSLSNILNLFLIWLVSSKYSCMIEWLHIAQKCFLHWFLAFIWIMQLTIADLLNSLLLLSSYKEFLPQPCEISKH